MKFRLRAVPIICLFGLTVAACVLGADVPKTETVQFSAGKDMVGGFIAEPTAAGRHPAVIVIHPLWGLNDWVKDQTQKLGEQGFVALAVDLYGGHTTTDANTAAGLEVWTER